MIPGDLCILARLLQFGFGQYFVLICVVDLQFEVQQICYFGFSWCMLIQFALFYGRLLMVSDCFRLYIVLQVGMLVVLLGFVLIFDMQFCRHQLRVVLLRNCFVIALGFVCGSRFQDKGLTFSSKIPYSQLFVLRGLWVLLFCFTCCGIVCVFQVQLLCFANRILLLFRCTMQCSRFLVCWWVFY